MQQTHFMFNKYKLNLEQTLDTTHQLYETLDEFGNYYKLDRSEQSHLTGKLMFFAKITTSLLDYDKLEAEHTEATTIENYNKFIRVHCFTYDESSLELVRQYYEDFFLAVIDDILNLINKNNLTDIDDILQLIDGYKTQYGYLNFQEQQFVVNCYYSTID